MLEIIITGYVTRRVHSSRAEQEDGLPEQGTTCPGNSKRATRILKQRHHAADSRHDFVGMGDRRGSRPGVIGALSTSTFDECPEIRQNGVLFDLALDEHGTVAKQAPEVEISTCNAIEPVANSLT